MSIDSILTSGRCEYSVAKAGVPASSFPELGASRGAAIQAQRTPVPPLQQPGLDPRGQNEAGTRYTDKVQTSQVVTSAPSLCTGGLEQSPPPGRWNGASEGRPTVLTPAAI